MKTTMKKLAATLLALILVLQVLPVLADEITSNTQGPIDNFRDKLEVTSPASIILVGTSIDLVATAGYNNLTWTSKPAEIAEVDPYGRVTAIAPGIVRITASEGAYKDSVILQVVEKETASSDSSDNSDNGNKTDAEETITIVVSANKDKYTYDGTDHVSGFTASSNAAGFNAANVKINEDKLVIAKDCGVYPVKYEASDFSYEGDGKAEFIVSDGWIQIKPAPVTVKANDATQTGNEVPEFTATVTGLVAGDDPDTIKYTFDVITAGDTTYIAPICESIQGNYRVTAQSGILVMENGVYRAVKLTSDWPTDKPAYAGTMITMTAELIGFENVDYTLQWQHSIDLEEWIDEPGANDTTYTFELNETTVQYTWRVVANY